MAGTKVVDFAGVINIRELTALLKSASLVISNDTGPGHIAGALGRPVVLIFGNSNPARVSPYGRKECIVAIDADKRGITHDNYSDKYSVEAITVGQVYEKACEQIERYRAKYI